MTKTISFSTVGLKFHKDQNVNIDDYISSLIGKTVILQHDTDNIDSHAIAVTLDGKVIGYVRRNDIDENNIYGYIMGCYHHCHIARFVDASPIYKSIITEVNFSDITPMAEKEEPIEFYWGIDAFKPEPIEEWRELKRVMNSMLTLLHLKACNVSNMRPLIDIFKIYDIYCETDEGEKIIVEMQNKSQPFFKNRSIYYVSESIARQGERGSSWNYEIDSVYLVAFLNFSPLDFKKQFRTDVVLAEKDTKEQFSDKLRMIYLQLPLFKKEADECENQVERWIYLLKNMETLNRLPWAAQSAVFKKLESIADVGGMTRAERLQYDEALKKYRDTISVFEGVRMEGREEGQKEEKIANARKMKTYGLALEMISDITGLTIDEVRDL